MVLEFQFQACKDMVDADNYKQVYRQVQALMVPSKTHKSLTKIIGVVMSPMLHPEELWIHRLHIREVFLNKLSINSLFYLF